MEDQSMEQPVVQPVARSSSMAVWYIALAVVAVGLGVLYYVMQSSIDEYAAPTASEQAAVPELTAGNTTADIGADLTQLEGTDAALDADASASASDVQGL